MNLLNVLLVGAATLMLAGCEYEAPLATEHEIPIDPKLIGLWEEVPEPGTTENEAAMLVLRYSDTEYLIQYPKDPKKGIYYRGYLIQVGETKLMQLELIGLGEGALENDETELYHVAKYAITDGSLQVWLMNDDVIDDDLKNTAELHQAVLDNIGNQELFDDDAGQFRRRKNEQPD